MKPNQMTYLTVFILPANIMAWQLSTSKVIRPLVLIRILQSIRRKFSLNIQGNIRRYIKFEAS
jgi:hypothetical protein